MALLRYFDKRNPKRWVALGFLLSLTLAGCNPSRVPPEVDLTERMSFDLWKAQAPVYAPEEYRSYETSLKKVKEDLIREGSRFVWFRNYDPIAERLKAVLKDGAEVLKKVGERKEAKRAHAVKELSDLEARIEELDRLSLTLNEGRLVRRNLMKAGLLVKEASLLLDRADYEGVGPRLTSASGYIKASEGVLLPIIGRYTDRTHIARWERWVDQVIDESREKAVPAIVVSKMERKLILYQDGKPFKTYGIGIGRNGLQDKQHAGDGATPEGCYRVIGKKNSSKYRKALLLDYPNEEDRREFLRIKKAGLISRQVGIGGSIEIHGGGKEGMTYGCVSLEDRHIDEVFESVTTGTPVAIVGTAFPKSHTAVPAKKVKGD